MDSICRRNSMCIPGAILFIIQDRWFAFYRLYPAYETSFRTQQCFFINPQRALPESWQASLRNFWLNSPRIRKINSSQVLKGVLSLNFVSKIFTERNISLNSKRFFSNSRQKSDKLSKNKTFLITESM